MTLLSRVKNRFVSAERKPRRILAGPFRGLTMNLSLRSSMQVYTGLFEREIYPWLNRLSKNAATAIDVGVCEGEFTLFFMKRTNASPVMAFEPDAVVRSALHSNLHLNDLRESDRLRIYPVFVSDRSGAREAPLDSLLSSIKCPCVIKLDVDGAEDDVLRGAVSLLGLPDVRWIIETHSAELERLCRQRLESAGFTVRIIRNAWWRKLVPDRRGEHNGVRVNGGHNRWMAAWKTSV